MASKNSFLGFVTSPRFLIGSLIILLLFLKRKTSSSSQVAQTIQQRITAAGYSANVGAWWVAVSKFETANFTSTLATRYNNYFGMKWSKAGGRASIDYNGSLWAYPSSVEDSVDLQLNYMQRFQYPTNFSSIDDMVDYMKRVGYFEEPKDEYLLGVKSRL